MNEEKPYRSRIYATDSRSPRIVDDWGSMHRENKHYLKVSVPQPVVSIRVKKDKDQ